MSGAPEPVNIRVLDREYTVGVGAEERDSLVAAARLLDARMRDVRGSNKLAAIDRVAVLAALNLAHELQQLQKDVKSREEQVARALVEMQDKLDVLLDT